MSAGFVPGTAAQCTTEVELSISCRNLVGKDILSKSDPMCVTYMKPFGESRWVEYHRTEYINNTHDPDFTKKVHVMYRFEEQQPIKFDIYDIDSSSTNLSDHDFLGSAYCTLGQIVSSGKVQLPLQSNGGQTVGDHQSFVVVTSEELSSCKDEVILQFSGHSLEKKTYLFFFGHLNPYLVFYKSTESGDFSAVFKTEVAHHTNKPRWRRFSVPVRQLCNGDYDRNIKISCFHSSSYGGDDSLVGECNVTLRTLSSGPSSDTKLQLIHPEKRRKPSYTHSGEIWLDNFETRKIYSFMDYMKGGTQLHCSIAIDFTASNGNPLAPESLHYIGPHPNMYEQAIQAVGTIIQDYDSDKLFPVLGFGARLPPDGRVSHEFFVNMNPTNPYCEKVAGVLAAYRGCIRQIQLSGPTNFAPVINHVAKFANAYRDGSSYFILLILTDGVITDMPQTTQAIVDASSLPLSIIIVGIGNADFSAMETLDADTVALSAGGRRAVRDIVQFVPFNKFMHMGDPQTAGLRLAREVLAEIPQQFIGYMKANNIAPKPPQENVIMLPPDPALTAIS